ncbi:hypothetical protein [Acetobacter sp.]|uniref:hypothetical protein n=1 Tax=Acetobacter sp. TaxID=440 RepID=UPI0039E9F8AF
MNNSIFLSEAPNRIAAPDRPNIVALIGENENGILRELSSGLMRTIEQDGYKGHIIDLYQPDWFANFLDIARSGIAMAWGHAGVGARLSHEDENIWEFLKIPFVSVLADPPGRMPLNHYIRSRMVANAYVFSEWLDIQKRFIHAPQYSTLINCVGVVPNKNRDVIPWRDRPQRMAFIKTGGNPEARRERWRDYPPRWRAILEDASSAAVMQGTGGINDLLFAACEQHGLQADQRPEIILHLMEELDLYVREYRMNTVVKALLPLPVHIYGRGWDHLAALPACAQFHPAFDAQNISTIYSATQFLINTSPNIGSGMHERVAYGLDARCCVVSDENDFSRKILNDIPTFFGFEANSKNLTEYFFELYHDTTDYTEATQKGVDLITHSFGGRSYMHELLNVAEELQVADILSPLF